MNFEKLVESWRFRYKLGFCFFLEFSGKNIAIRSCIREKTNFV